MPKGPQHFIRPKAHPSSYVPPLKNRIFILLLAMVCSTTLPSLAKPRLNNAQKDSVKILEKIADSFETRKLAFTKVNLGRSLAMIEDFKPANGD